MANKQARGVALGGLITAVSLILLLAASAIPAGDLILPAIAGLLLITIVLELNARWAWAIFAATSILGLLFFFGKTAAIFYYVLFFGHYPIVKNHIERIHSRILQWVVKILLFNVCFFTAYGLVVFVFGAPASAARIGVLFLIPLGNAAFILYDIAVSRLVVTYVYHIKKRLH